MMFGHYILNNISIALRTFASGLLAGLGTLLVLLFNGVIIGSVAGHLQHIGHGDPFWRFVAGHGAFELTAIVIAGGAGLQLGMKLLAPAAAAWMPWSKAAASGPGCAWAWRSCCWWPRSSKRSGRRLPKCRCGASSAWPACCGPACCCGCGAAGAEAAMRIDRLDVALRARSGWEAMELGSALSRRHARAVWGSWLLASAPLFVIFNALGWWLDAFGWAWLAMWWCKPLFERAPLYVLSRGIFGEPVGALAALRAQRSWGNAGFWGYLGWRRFSVLRSLCLPVNLLEGNAPAQRGARRRAVAAGAAGAAVVLTLACMAFEGCWCPVRSARCSCSCHWS